MLVCMLTISLLFTLSFIWGHSLQGRVSSQQRSGQFERFIRPIILLLPIRALHSEVAISLLTRKLAHILEFLALGLQLYLLAYVLLPMSCQGLLRLWLVALTAALLDEGLQFFSQRAPMLGDLLLDGLGAMVGMLLAWLAVHPMGEAVVHV